MNTEADTEADQIPDARADTVNAAIAAQKMLKAHRITVSFEVSRRTRFLDRFVCQVKTNTGSAVSQFLTPQIESWISNPTVGL